MAARALLVFVLVVLTAVPAAIPFLLLEDSYIALRGLEQAIMTVLLFLVGYLWGKHARGQGRCSPASSSCRSASRWCWWRSRSAAERIAGIFSCL